MSEQHLEKIAIRRLGSRPFLEIGEEQVEIKDYKIIASANGETHIEFSVQCNCELMEFELLTTKESLQQQRLKSMSDAP